jgi:tetratricopeptide (TPR) repeat protein
MTLKVLRTCFAFAFLALPVAAMAATTVDDLVPTNLPVTLPGSYLAGRGADFDRNLGAAVKYYAEAFAEDPENPTVGERLVLLGLASGQTKEAFGFARKLDEVDSGNAIARIALAAQAIETNDLAAVDGIAGSLSGTALAKLTGGLMNAWAAYGLGQVEKALQIVDQLSGPSWYGVFKDYHRALLLDAAGRGREAADAIDKAYQSDAGALKVLLAYATIHARNGEKDKAAKVLFDAVAGAPVQAPARALLKAIQDNDKLEPVIGSAQMGAADVLYGIGAAIGTDQGPELPGAYLRLSAFLDPNSDLTTMSLGDTFQASDLCEDAIAIYRKMPMSSSLKRQANLQIGSCLMALDKLDEAIAFTKTLVDDDPKDVDAAIQLGNAYRASDRFAEAAEAYTKGVEASGDPKSLDWRILYYRGVSYTMADEWPRAEADFQQALQINPGQPQVLNYLGYSWVDKGLHLDAALKMIRDAVDQRPNDGYIVDSLGWAYFKLGRYDEAVKALERAVLLRPGESTLNDHLGDAYWKVGRKREAMFQWAHARDFDPEPGELPRILEKLEHGLADAAKPVKRSDAGSPTPGVRLASLVFPGMMLTVPAAD